MILVHDRLGIQGMICKSASEVMEVPHPPRGIHAALKLQWKGWDIAMLPLHLEDSPTEPRLLISAGAEWFQIAGRPRVTLETRIPLRRLLLALGDLKQRSPGSVLPVTAAFDAGWPGERATPTAAAMRVYTAIHSLRRLGLRGLLVRRRRGYVLDIDVQVLANESVIPPPLTSNSLEEAENAVAQDSDDEPIAQTA